MSDLFRRRARFSRCGRFRTALGRAWGVEGPRVGFVGLNPSTADGTSDDPTTRRCVGFARRMEASSLVMVNLFGYRATRPAQLWRAGAPVGGGTNRVLREELRACSLVVACWGNVPKGAHARARSVLGMLDRLERPVLHLGLTGGGHPRHPLYTRADAPLQPWPIDLRKDPYRA